jgi:hypothetical protein
MTLLRQATRVMYVTRLVMPVKTVQTKTKKTKGYVQKLSSSGERKKKEKKRLGFYSLRL